MTTDPHIRLATTDDAAQLAGLAERTFRDTFSEQNTPDDMESYVQEAFSVGRVRSELEDPASTFLIAFRPSTQEPVGYAKLRTGTSEPSVTGPDPIELERIYVDRSALGTGLGAALLRACLSVASAASHRTIWLGVWERNVRAISFYERWGFETVGEHVFRLGSDDQTDLVMVRPLPDSPPEGEASARSG